MKEHIGSKLGHMKYELENENKKDVTERDVRKISLKRF